MLKTSNDYFVRKTRYIKRLLLTRKKYLSVCTSSISLSRLLLLLKFKLVNLYKTVNQKHNTMILP